MEYAIMVPHGVGSLPCLERCRTLKTQKNPCHALRPLKSNRTAVDVIRASINLRKKVLSKKDGSPGHLARRRAEPVIGPRFAGTRWRFRPVMTIPIGMLFEN